jgi:hypothetical protein
LERGHQTQRSVTESPRGLDEREPRGFVAVAVVVQTAMALERPHGDLRRRAELTGLGAGRSEPGGTEPTLEVADGVAVLTADQLLETRNSSNSWSS